MLPLPLPLPLLLLLDVEVVFLSGIFQEAILYLSLLSAGVSFAVRLELHSSSIFTFFKAGLALTHPLGSPFLITSFNLLLLQISFCATAARPTTFNLVTPL